jgi:peptidoglycan/LPS O-acetylase OafA/YrhL
MILRPTEIIRPLPYPAIDGMRFYAAFVVFLAHLLRMIGFEYLRIPYETWGTSDSLWMRALYVLGDGSHGVDVFFVISGFLIGRIVLEDKRFSYCSFVRRRFLRIYPAFLVSLLAAVAMAISLGYRFDFVAFLQNLIFLNAIPSLHVQAYNYVTWTLGYEFAFYLILPAILLVSKRTGKLTAAVLICAAALVMLLLILPRGYLHIISLFFGVVLAAIPDEKLRSFARRVPLVLTLIAYEGLLIVRATTDFFSYPRQFYLLFLPLVALTFVKVTFDGGRLAAIFSSVTLRFLGTISYSMYLWHPIVIAFVYFIVLVPLGLYSDGRFFIPALVVGSCVGTLAVSTGSYLALERFYFKGRRATTSSAVREGGSSDASSAKETGEDRLTADQQQRSKLGTDSSAKPLPV